ncbi:MAG TPA: hypothetical protein VF911_20780 [Thermoanaerobaculia bacterium]
MKRSIASVVVVLAVLTLAFPGCKGREQRGAGGEASETIAPASPQPAPTGTEAMTQTVDVESGRSEAEGGVLTTPDPGVQTATDTAAAAATGTATTAPPPATTTR